jgi:hypothetical protein
MFRPHTAILSCYRILSSRSLTDGQKNKYSVLNECKRMLKYNIQDTENDVQE